jgi:hypothetical protein
MSNWQRTLDIKDAWEKALEDEMSYRDLAKVMLDKLQELMPFSDLDIEAEKRDIIDDLECLVNHPDDLCSDDIDDVVERLYGWGDIPLNNNWPPKKVCWIKTKF